MNIEITKENIVKYLLGQLPAEANQQIEDIYFEDDKIFQEFLIIEEGLIDDYITGQLSPVRRQMFENSYLASPERRARVRSAELFLESVKTVPPPEVQPSSPESEPPSFPSRAFFFHNFGQRFKIYMWGMASASALVVVIFIGELYGIYWLNIGYEQVDKDKEEIDRQYKELAQERANPPDPSSAIAVAKLLPVRPRGEQQTQVLSLPSKAIVMLLQVPINSTEDIPYKAVLTGDDTELLRLNNLPSRREGSGRIIEIPVPSSALNKRFYMLAIQTPDDDEVGLLTFEVVRN